MPIYSYLKKKTKTQNIKKKENQMSSTKKYCHLLLSVYYVLSTILYIRILYIIIYISKDLFYSSLLLRVESRHKADCKIGHVIVKGQFSEINSAHLSGYTTSKQSRVRNHRVLKKFSFLLHILRDSN